MRYIQVPESITLRPHVEQLALDPKTKGETVSFRKVAFGCWLDDARAIRGGFSKQVRWSKVIDLFSTCEPGKWIALEDEDWSMLKEIAESPAISQPPTVAVQLLAFTRTVLDAPDKLPAVLTDGVAVAELPS